MQNIKAKILTPIGLILLNLLLFTGFSHAQTDFRPGYVIKPGGDTLFGEIDYRSDLLMGEVCRFKINDKENEIRYSPDDIIGYRFIDSKYYISKEVNGKRLFLEFLIKGKVSIYYLRDNNGDHYFIEKEGIRITEIPYKQEIRHKGDTDYFYESTEHIGVMKYYMLDAPEFQSRIERMGKPEHKNLIKLAEDYHNKVCKDESCVIYEKKIPLFKISMEIVGGIYYHNFDYSGDPRTYIIIKKYLQTGVITNLCMPRTSENLYFRSGIIYSNVDAYKTTESLYFDGTGYHTLIEKSDNFKKSLFEIPLQLEYIYPKGIVRPKFAYGINIYAPYDLTYSLMGGLNIKLQKSIYLTVMYQLEYYGLMILPQEMGPQSLLFGLQIKL
jgi:hypothetical protein